MTQRYHEWRDPVTCRTCGTIYPPGTALCAHCGRYLIAEYSGEDPAPDNQVHPVIVAPDPPVYSLPWTPNSHTRRRFRVARWYLATAAALTGLMIAGGGWAWWYAHSGQEFHGPVPPQDETLHTPISATPQSSPHPSATITLTGPEQYGGYAFFPVIIWQHTQGRWVSVRGNALLDTGGGGIVVDGTQLGRAGMQNTGQTVEQFGVGSAPATGTDWPGLYVAPVADPQDYILANQTEPSGLGPAINRDGTDEVINLGGSVIDQGQFTVHGNQWTWTYTPVSPSGN